MTKWKPTKEGIALIEECRRMMPILEKELEKDMMLRNMASGLGVLK